MTEPEPEGVDYLADMVGPALLPAGPSVTIEGISPGIIPIIDPTTGGPLHVAAGERVWLMYDEDLGAYVPTTPPTDDERSSFHVAEVRP